MEERLHRLENPRQRADGWRSVYRDKKTLDSSKKKKKNNYFMQQLRDFNDNIR